MQELEKIKEIVEIKTHGASNSFTKEQIIHDYIVEKCEYADNGDIVVALIDDSATVKRFYRKDGKVYTVNPFATIFSDDNYYLVCYDDKYLPVTH